MALGFIARAMQAGLAKLGEPSFLDGIDIGKVSLQRGVDLFVGSPGRSDANYMAQVEIAVIPSSVSPAVGQTLVHPEGVFVLSRLHEDNGYTRTYIVVTP